MTGARLPPTNPYVPDEASIPEFTLPAPIIVGVILGIIFGGFLALPGPEDWADRLGVDTRRGALHHALPHLFQNHRYPPR